MYSSAHDIKIPFSLFSSSEMVSKHNTGTEGTGSASQWRVLNEAALEASVYGGLMLGFLFFLTVRLRGGIPLQGRENWKENRSQPLFSS